MFMESSRWTAGPPLLCTFAPCARVSLDVRLPLLCLYIWPSLKVASNQV